MTSSLLTDLENARAARDAAHAAWTAAGAAYNAMPDSADEATAWRVIAAIGESHAAYTDAARVVADIEFFVRQAR